MADKFFQARSYFNYWLDAVDEHSLHSPFFFDLHTKVIKSDTLLPIESVEKLRRQLLEDRRSIQIQDLGSRANKSIRKVSDIAQSALSPIWLSNIYQRLISHFKLTSIVELGTSFGINTLYLSSNPKTKVVTMEGVPEIADIAQLTFEFSESKNIQFVQGNIDQTLEQVLQNLRRVDFALVDANHRYGPTVQYLSRLLTKVNENSVLVIDDIHYSKEMEQAWNEIKNHRLVYGSADLYRCGILFFDPSLNKQHVILQV